MGAQHCRNGEDALVGDVPQLGRPRESVRLIRLRLYHLPTVRSRGKSQETDVRPRIENRSAGKGTIPERTCFSGQVRRAVLVMAEMPYAGCRLSRIADSF